MFYGEYEHTIDNKGRLIIPAKFRQISKESYVEKFFVTRGLDQCLFVFTEEEWRNQEHKFKNLPFTKKDSRKFNRLFFSGAFEAVIDKQGRILVPKYLKEYAQIKRNVIVVGVSNRFEVWDQSLWNEYYNNTQNSYEEIAEDLFDGNEEN
jgi:MraZ protein